MARNTRDSSTHKDGWLWPVIALIIVLFLLWGLGNHYNWWKAAASTSTTHTTTGATGATGSTGATGATGTAGTNGSSSTSTAPTSPIATLSTNVNNGDTKEAVNAEATGLAQSCTVTVNSTLGGKQEVCAYSAGNKIVTVTYMNNRAVSVMRSGF